jgi:hypothetical protein
MNQIVEVVTVETDSISVDVTLPTQPPVTVEAITGGIGPKGDKGDPGPKGDKGDPGVTFPDAPSDTFTYGRHALAWDKTLPLTGGTLTGPLVGTDVSMKQVSATSYLETGLIIALDTDSADLNLMAGAGTTIGGDLFLEGGVAYSGVGGRAVVIGGSNFNGTGGSAEIYGGDGTTGYNGGDVTIGGGKGIGAGKHSGNITLTTNYVASGATKGTITLDAATSITGTLTAKDVNADSLESYNSLVSRGDFECNGNSVFDGDMTFGNAMSMLGTLETYIFKATGAATFSVIPTIPVTTPTLPGQVASKSYVDSKAGTTYTLPTASTTVLGGVKVDGSTITISNGIISSTGGTGGGITDAPNDGKAYIRKSVAWSTLTSGDVTTALTFTPYNATNPSGYQTAAQVTTTLAPYALTTSVPVGSSSLPVINGTAAAGSGTKWSKDDHVHPIDTTRAPINNPTFTGKVTSPIFYSNSYYNVDNNTVGATGGHVNVIAGSGQKDGGTVSIIAGTGSTNKSGDVDIYAGDSYGNPTCGSVTIMAGGAVLGNFTGGDVTIWGGFGSGAGKSSGDIRLTTDNVAGGATLGTITLDGPTNVTGDVQFFLGTKVEAWGTFYSLDYAELNVVKFLDIPTMYIASPPTLPEHMTSKKYVDEQRNYTIASFAPGVLTASQILLVHQVGQQIVFPANFGNSASGASSRSGSIMNATASTTLVISRCTSANDPTNSANFTQIGTIVFAPGGHVGTLTTQGSVAITVLVGEFIKVTGPATPDVALANVFFTLVGNR